MQQGGLTQIPSRVQATDASYYQDGVVYERKHTHEWRLDPEKTGVAMDTSLPHTAWFYCNTLIQISSHSEDRNCTHHL